MYNLRLMLCYRETSKAKAANASLTSYEIHKKVSMENILNQTEVFIFGQSIFVHFSCRALDVRKFDVGENNKS